MPKSVLKRIRKFNKDRHPGLLELKYEAMKESPFRFFRGACHLFYEDLPRKSFLLKSPNTWLSGDLHLENFGSFKGNNRLSYFDMNDFDESLLGPCLLDITRLCTSLFLATEFFKINRTEARKFARTLLGSYAEHLSKGLIREIEQETAKGVVKKFLEATTQRTRKEMLAKRIHITKNGAAIKHDPIRCFKLADKSVRQRVTTAVEKWAAKNTKHPKFFKVTDVAIRAAGTGSIGIERYLALVVGRGGPDGYFLLDVKQALPASALKRIRIKQPKWNSEGERLVAIQRRVQAESPAFLSPLKIGTNDFIIKELQPIEDKMDFTKMEKDVPKMTQLLSDMGAIVAWNNLRSGGRQGSSIADELMKFGSKMNKIEEQIINYSSHYADVTTGYWKEFKKAGL